MSWETQIPQRTYPSQMSIVSKSRARLLFANVLSGAILLALLPCWTPGTSPIHLTRRVWTTARLEGRCPLSGLSALDAGLTINSPRRRRRWRSTPLVGRGAVKRSLPDRDNWTLSPTRGVERPLGRSPDDGDTARSGLRGRSLRTCCPLGRAASVLVDWLNASQFWRDCRRARTAGSSSAWGQTSLPCRRLRAGALRIRQTPLNAATRICWCVVIRTHKCLQSGRLQDHAAGLGSIAFLSLPPFLAHIV